MRSLKLEGRKLTFHSLRHDFRDAPREAEVEGALADYLMGHAQEGMGAQYGASCNLTGSAARIHHELESGYAFHAENASDAQSLEQSAASIRDLAGGALKQT